jgi:hypothetical protein
MKARQSGQIFGCAVFGQIVRRGTDDLLDREYAPDDQLSGWGEPGAKPEDDLLAHAVRETIVQQQVETDFWVFCIEFGKHWDQHFSGRARGTDPYRALDSFGAGPDLCHGAPHRIQPRLDRFQETQAFDGEAALPGGTVKQPHAQLFFKLANRLAHRLRADAQIDGSLVERSGVCRLGKNRDGFKCVHGVMIDNQWWRVKASFIASMGIDTGL